ncbi:mitochondria protoheme IX farnesyltransferase [Ascobolus immersus RN42]|uniref:Protoheme IX farnesyltransferase, mitochondrial n=1 Tax=Ascobolus immersus RN42 TaxID=1160509 RepID=A0A3N4HK67_ASCIM|nr:mitochondria protoheme IX farnesyltransferase [Ascobolus immersus RN42]
MPPRALSSLLSSLNCGAPLSRRPSLCFQCFTNVSGRRGSPTIFTNRAASTQTNGGIRRWSTAGAVSNGNAGISKQFFAANSFPAKEIAINTVVEADPLAETAVLPHRRRQLERKKAAESKTSTTDHPEAIPPDASSLLSTESQQATSPFKRTFFTYLSLSKPRLSALVVLTTMVPYALYPLDPILSTVATEAPSLNALTLLYLTSGTALCSASANAFNMIIEPAYDAQMTRTRNRPLVRKLLSTRNAILFAVGTGLTGATLLYYGVNPTVAGLGALNILLYAGVYTPMKRVSVLNTWVGAIVGGIPPLMGWAAASGAHALSGTTSEILSHPGGWLLAGLLFAWQFPHFNALSWTIKEEYKRAGYVMASWKYPKLNARVALRYSLLFFPLCIGLTYYGVTDWGFVATSTAVNAWNLQKAWRFYKVQTPATARGLFWASVWHLPLILGLGMLHKNGVWERVWRQVSGGNSGEEILV